MPPDLLVFTFYNIIGIYHDSIFSKSQSWELKKTVLYIRNYMGRVVSFFGLCEAGSIQARQGAENLKIILVDHNPIKMLQDKNPRSVINRYQK
jgi:hypothetical protein